MACVTNPQYEQCCILKVAICTFIQIHKCGMFEFTAPIFWVENSSEILVNLYWTPRCQGPSSVTSPCSEDFWHVNEMLQKQPASYNFSFLEDLTFFSWLGMSPEAFLLIWLLTSSCRLLKNAVDDRTDFALAFSTTCMRQQDNVRFQASPTK